MVVTFTFGLEVHLCFRNVFFRMLTVAISAAMSLLSLSFVLVERGGKLYFP